MRCFLAFAAFCLALPILAVANPMLSWDAPNAFVDGKPFDAATNAVIYKLYAAKNGQPLELRFTTPATAALTLTVPVSQFAFMPGECVAVSAVYQGAESEQSAPFCWGNLVAPGNIRLIFEVTVP